MGSNNNTNREADSYVSRVINSKVAKSLKKGGPTLKERDVLALRTKAKITCPDQYVTCNILEEQCLYNIKNDPCERNNLARDPAYAGILQDLKERLASSVSRVAASRNKPGGKKMQLYLCKLQIYLLI